jgi:hypothetical protein
MTPEQHDAVVRFISWLYEYGPSADTVPRDKLLRFYLFWLSQQP